MCQQLLFKQNLLNTYLMLACAVLALAAERLHNFIENLHVK